MIVADVVKEPDFRTAVPSVTVTPKILPSAEMLEEDEMTPLVIEPAVVSDPACNTAAPSVNVVPKT